MSEKLNEQELLQYIADKTKADSHNIKLVLKHEQVFMDNAKADAKGEVDIDSDDLVDYIMGQREVKLDEITVEAILDAEMDYLIKQGIAGYLD